MKNALTAVATAPRHLLAEILLAAFWAESLTLCVPIFAQLVFDKVIVHNSFSTLYLIGCGVIVAALFEGLLSYLYARHVHILSACVDEFMTHAALSKLLLLPLRFFERSAKGRISTAVREIQSIRDFLSASSVGSVVDAVVMMLVLALIAVYSPFLAAVVAATIPVLVTISAVMRPSVLRQYRALNQSQSHYESLLNEGLQNMATIKSMAMEPLWERRWLAAHDAFVAATLRARRGAAVEDSLLRLLHRLAALAVLWVGATEVLRNNLSLGQLLACYMLAIRALMPSGRLFQVFVGVARIQAAQKELGALEAEPVEAAPAHGMPYVSGDIIVQDLSFRYGDGPWILEQLNLVLPQAAFVGVVGRSGSGKSTLVRLLQRHAVPVEGRIRLGGIDLQDLALHDFRENVVVVAHDAALFRGSIRENVLGRFAQATTLAIWDACEITRAHEFIGQLEEGLDTPLDERAPQLSSGQRQRIALARAVLARPRILILDEATNALDRETEAQVLANVRRALPDCTLVVVTHREHALREVDCVIEIANGSASVRDAAPVLWEPARGRAYGS